MDLSCIIAALLLFTGNLILIIFYGLEKNRDSFDYEQQISLDPTVIEEEWEWRMANKPKFLAAGILNGLGWLFFAFPMIQLAWILSKRGTTSLGLHIGIVLLVLIGSFTEWFSRFLYIGATMATEMLASKFDLDNWGYDASGLGWRTLEVTNIVTTGLITFIDAFEWIALFFIMTFVHVSVRKWRVTELDTFGMGWNVLGLFIAMLSLCDFAAEILRLTGNMVFVDIAFWYSSANRLVFLPLWLLMLGCTLPRAKEKSESVDTNRVVNDHMKNGLAHSQAQNELL